MLPVLTYAKPFDAVALVYSVNDSAWQKDQQR
jgi:hypothetical protein